MTSLLPAAVAAAAVAAVCGVTSARRYVTSQAARDGHMTPEGAVLLVRRRH